MHGEGGLLGGNGNKAHLLRKEPSDQVVHVLVGAAFPEGVGMDEEELCIEFYGDPLMPGDLFRTPDLGKFEVPNSNQGASSWFIDDS